jgi:hypothetical protein
LANEVSLGEKGEGLGRFGFFDRLFHEAR